MRIIVGIILCYSLTILSCNEPDVNVVSVNSSLDTASYAFGVYLANQFKPFDNVNCLAVAKAMEDVYKAAMPYLLLNILVMALLIAFPVLAQLLPGMMK